MVGGVAQVVEDLPSKHKVKFKPQYCQKKKKKHQVLSCPSTFCYGISQQEGSHQLTPIIQATQEAEIRRISV
jgi:hypothetical protein